MSTHHTDPTTPASPLAGQPEANGYHPEAPRESDPVRERFRLHAQCAKLRHWCRGLLDAEGTEGVLPPEVERELLTTAPDLTMDEVFTALRIISQGEPLPSNVNAVTSDVGTLAAQRHKLSDQFFKLFDAACPDETAFTDEFFQELSEQPQATESIGELLDRLERETQGGC